MDPTTYVCQHCRARMLILFADYYVCRKCDAPSPTDGHGDVPTWLPNAVTQ